MRTALRGAGHPDGIDPRVKLQPKTCSTCEYFDVGGETILDRVISSGVAVSGDCGNSTGAKFNPVSDEVHSCHVQSSTL